MARFYGIRRKRARISREVRLYKVIILTDRKWKSAFVGKICAEIVNSCPPCCPIVLPGQIIDNSVVEYLKEYTDIEKIAVVSNSINSKTGQIEEEG